MADEQQCRAMLISTNNGLSHDIHYILSRLTFDHQQQIDLIQVDVTNLTAAFSAKIDRAAIIAKTKRQFQNYDKWCEHTRGALLDNLKGYSVTVENNKLCWHLHKDAMQITLFALNLTPHPNNEIIKNIFEYSSARDKGLTAIYKKQEQLKNDRNEALAIANDCVKKTELLETRIFDRFANVLNAKKRKIEQLITDAEIYKQAPILTRLSGSSNADQSQMTSNSDFVIADDENGADTDTEREEFNKSRKMVAAKRQTSKSANAATNEQVKKSKQKDKLMIAPIRDKIPRIKRTRNSTKSQQNVDIDDLI